MAQHALCQTPRVPCATRHEAADAGLFRSARRWDACTFETVVAGLLSPAHTAPPPHQSSWRPVFFAPSCTSGAQAAVFAAGQRIAGWVAPTVRETSSPTSCHALQARLRRALCRMPSSDIRVRIVGTPWYAGFWHIWAVLSREGMSPEVVGNDAFEVEVTLQTCRRAHGRFAWAFQPASLMRWRTRCR